MAKQMEGDNRQRRKAAAAARRAGSSASEDGVTTGASKQPSRSSADDHLENLSETQRGEAKQAGADVPTPLRGKGRNKPPLTGHP